MKSDQWQLEQQKKIEEDRHSQYTYVLMAVIAGVGWGNKVEADTVAFVKDLTQHRKWWRFHHLDGSTTQVDEEYVQGALITDPVYALVYALRAAVSRGSNPSYPVS